jgi:hypothetical protein
MNQAAAREARKKLVPYGSTICKNKKNCTNFAYYFLSIGDDVVLTGLCGVCRNRERKIFKQNGQTAKSHKLCQLRGAECKGNLRNERYERCNAQAEENIRLNLEPRILVGGNKPPPGVRRVNGASNALLGKQLFSTSPVHSEHPEFLKLNPSKDATIQYFGFQKCSPRVVIADGRGFGNGFPVENLIQAFKVYPGQLDASGDWTAAAECEAWQAIANKEGPRRKGSGAPGVTCITNRFPTYDGKWLNVSYYDSRFPYCAMLAKMVVLTDDFLEMQRLSTVDRYNILILGHDGPREYIGADGYDPELMQRYYRQEHRPFGHEVVLYCLLANKTGAKMPWDVYWEDEGGRELYRNVDISIHADYIRAEPDCFGPTQPNEAPCKKRKRVTVDAPSGPVAV